MLTAWFVITWFILRGADSMRPSALQRPFTLLWMYIGAFVVLAAVTVSENNFKIAGGYFMVAYFAAIFLALLISYLEFFALPKKARYIQHISNESADDSSRQHSLPSSRPITASENHEGDDDDATERTSLLRDNRTTFSGGYGSRAHTIDGATETENDTAGPITLFDPFIEEQSWSGQLPRWTWLFQFLLLSVIPIVLVGQVALLMTSALNQTPSDGSPVLTVYLFFAVLCVLLLLPFAPFIHRFHYPIPTLLFFIFVATLIYNLIAFPFSDNSRLKVYFVQQVDLDTGINEVSLTGLMPYVKDIIAEIPSATGKNVNCTAPEYTARQGLTKCVWPGIPPDVRNGKGLPAGVSPEKGYAKWLDYNITRSSANKTEATIHITGKNTRACRIFFDRPIADFNVTGFGIDNRFPRITERGCKSIRLWSREWNGSWKVSVKWDGPKGLDGKVVCLWSDANDPTTIPAFTEVLGYMPRWSMATKLSDGLVEGSKVFKI
jgi:hypothetical protein